MAHPNDTARFLELQMIASDGDFHFEVMRQIYASKKSGILIPAYMPHIARFVIESFSWFKGVSPEQAQVLKRSHEALIQSMRHKTKLFEERNITAMLADVAKHQKTHFIDSHTGPFAWLKKQMQADLGLYLYQQHLISTTYTMVLYLTGEDGLGQGAHADELKRLGSLGYSVGEEVGAYLGGVVSAFRGEHVQFDASADNAFDELVHWKDVKSSEYLASVFNGPSSLEINTCLLIFTAYYNFVQHIVRRFAPLGGEAFFRLKYLTLHHLRASLQKLQDTYYQTGLLTDKSRQALSTILKNKELKALLSQPKFRNVIVHYDLEQLRVADAELNSFTTFSALVEHTFTASTVEDLDALIDRLMSKIAACLEEWLVLQ